MAMLSSIHSTGVIHPIVRAPPILGISVVFLHSKARSRVAASEYTQIKHGNGIGRLGAPIAGYRPQQRSVCYAVVLTTASNLAGHNQRKVINDDEL